MVAFSSARLIDEPEACVFIEDSDNHDAAESASVGAGLMRLSGRGSFAQMLEVSDMEDVEDEHSDSSDEDDSSELVVATAVESIDDEEDCLKTVADSEGKNVPDYIRDRVRCGILPGFILFRYGGGIFSSAYHGYIIYNEDLARSYAKSRGISDSGWNTIDRNKNKWWRMDTYMDALGFTNNEFRLSALFQGEEFFEFRNDITNIVDHRGEQSRGELNVVYRREGGFIFSRKGHYCLENRDDFMSSLPGIDGEGQVFNVFGLQVAQNIELGKPIFN